MNKTFEFFLGILVGGTLTLLVSIAFHNDQNARIMRLERQQAQLIEMLTYVPTEIDAPEVEKLFDPKFQSNLSNSQKITFKGY